jgi:hypothetical protein
MGKRFGVESAERFASDVERLYNISGHKIQEKIPLGLSNREREREKENANYGTFFSLLGFFLCLVCVLSLALVFIKITHNSCVDSSS